MTFLPLVACGIASCTPEPVRLVADRCWSVSVGNEVQGAAVLYIPSPSTFHVGPKVAGGPDCASYPIKFANDASSRAYERIKRKELPYDVPGGPKERVVTLSGNVVSGETGGSHTIQITQLRFATARELQAKRKNMSQRL